MPDMQTCCTSWMSQLARSHLRQDGQTGRLRSQTRGKSKALNFTTPLNTKENVKAGWHMQKPFPGASDYMHS